MSYLDRVVAMHQAAQQERYAKKQEVDAARAASWRDTMRPLKDRLADLLSTIPDEVKANGLSLSELQVQLRGRTTGKAHCGETATALRELGYRRARVWKNSAEAHSAIWKEK